MGPVSSNFSALFFSNYRVHTVMKYQGIVISSPEKKSIHLRLIQIVKSH